MPVETLKPRAVQAIETEGDNVTDGLNDQERAFLQKYLHTGNATEAAESVGLPYPGQNGHRWLKLKRIQQALRTELKSRHIDPDNVLAELSSLAYANVARFMDADGLINPQKVRDHGHLVKRYKYKVVKHADEDNPDEIFEVEIELHDRHAALVNVGRKYKMFGNEQTTNIYMLTIQQFQADVQPLLDECLDPSKAGRWGEGMAELARRYGAAPKMLEANVTTPTAGSPENSTTGIVARPEPLKEPVSNVSTVAGPVASVDAIEPWADKGAAGTTETPGSVQATTEPAKPKRPYHRGRAMMRRRDKRPTDEPTPSTT